jgi:hypothetical protein
MAEYSYSDANTLTEVGKEKMYTLAQDDPIFDYFPIEEKDTSIISWEQEDADAGLQQVRGINGAPKRVKALNAKRYTVDPGVFGEFRLIDEKEITERRKLGTYGTPIDIDDLVAKEQDRLLGRENDRIRVILWLLVTKGQYNLSSETGHLIYAAAFDFPVFTAATAWSDTANATPLADIRNLMLQGIDLVTDADFGAQAKLFLNQKKIQQMISNKNAADLGGRFTNISAARGLARINEIMVEEGLPTIVPHNGAYVDENGTKQRMIPDDGGVLFGFRRENMGSYTMTRNATNPNAEPGPYDEVVESTRPPKTIEVHRGHNGGAEVHFGKSIQRLAGI